MFKIKAIVIGLLFQIGLIAMLSALLAVAAVNFENVLSENYILFLEFIFTISAGVSSYISARIAWEKAVLYGVFLGVFAVILRIIISVIFMADFTFTSALIKFSILIALCVCCAMLGVTFKKKSKF
ncbi:MAG: DUF3792 family protein [Clostridia bacterium]